MDSGYGLFKRPKLLAHLNNSILCIFHIDILLNINKSRIVIQLSALF